MTPATARRRLAPPLTLVLEAVGGPRQLGGKLTRLWRTARPWLDPAELERRLTALERRGYLHTRPTRVQLLFGGIDMVRFMIEPAAREYYAAQGIDFAFHQLLRVLDDPVSMIDPTGVFSDRETIIGHLMQVVHLNPVYDLQLLEMFADGLEELERQLEAMTAGTHPRHGTIGAIVEDPGYHARLLDYVRRYRNDRTTPPPIRPQPALRRDPHFAAAERTFATLPGFLDYCARLPRSPGALWARLRALDRFPLDAGATPA